MAEVLIAGAGIGGLSAAIALERAGVADLRVSVIEQSSQLGEVGAGVQLGPNVTRVLRAWGVDKILEPYAFEPNSIEVLSAKSGKLLAELPLGLTFRNRYGAPYLTAHRADLHACLHSCLINSGFAHIELNQKLHSVRSSNSDVEVLIESNKSIQGQISDSTNTVSTHQRHYSALIGADGVWSKVRDIFFDQNSSSDRGSTKSVTFSGDLAYRSLVLQKMLPQHLRSTCVKVWLGPNMHLVQYPIRAGEWLNSVLILSPRPHNHKGFVSTKNVIEALDWTIKMSGEEKAFNIQSIFPQVCLKIQDTLRAIESWNVWPLMRGEPLAGSEQMVNGRVALLGDAAHPMLPYLAQGAGMAIEDAFALGEQFRAFGAATLVGNGIEGPLLNYAKNRWSRNARVQSRALQNAGIFHAEGGLAWARDRSLQLWGAKLLDMPWLYGYRA
jgi:salicylate hydroxylase